MSALDERRELFEQGLQHVFFGEASGRRASLDRPLVLKDASAARLIHAQHRYGFGLRRIESELDEVVTRFCEADAEPALRCEDGEAIPLRTERVGEHSHDRAGGVQKVLILGGRLIELSAARGCRTPALVDSRTNTFSEFRGLDRHVRIAMSADLILPTRNG